MLGSSPLLSVWSLLRRPPLPTYHPSAWAEGRALLDELQAWATQPQFVYRHHWRLGDLLIWDNTGTMHRALPYAFDSGRTMHRTTLVGEEALA